LLIKGPEAPPLPPVPPPDPGPTCPPPDVSSTEAASGEYQNDVQSPTGTTFSVIYKDEPSRQKQTSRAVFLEFFEPGRPDLDALTYAGRTMEELSVELGTEIDWEAPGIQNLALVVEWLKRLEEDTVTSCIVEVVRRNRNSAAPIRSWQYFEAEMARLLTGSQNDTG
jgi:hypothetical protein